MISVSFRRTGWRLAAAAVVIVLFCGAGSRDVASQAVSPSPTATSAPVVDRVARIDQFLQQYIDGSQVAGIVALVLQDGQPVYEKAVGWRDKEAGDRIRIDSIFRIASQSKAITSAAIMMLVEEGKVRLADPASRFIPAFATTTVAERTGAGAEISIVPARRQIQIKDLLTHTSGMSYGTEAHIAKLYQEKGLGPAAGMGWYFADKTEPVCASIERLATLPFLSHPGDAYVYGYSTDVLGCVVERASGLSLDEFVRMRITAPLGMSDTHFYLPAAKRDRLAVVYGTASPAGITRSEAGPRGQGAYVDGPRVSYSGGAGLLSTARDYARFLEMIRRDGVHEGRRLLGTRAVALMRTNQIGTIRGTNGLGYGYGFETTDRFGASELDPVGAFGWGGAYGSIYRVDPESKLVIVLMFQMIPNATDLRQKFPTLVYQAFAN